VHLFVLLLWYQPNKKDELRRAGGAETTNTRMTTSMHLALALIFVLLGAAAALPGTLPSPGSDSIPSMRLAYTSTAGAQKPIRLENGVLGAYWALPVSPASKDEWSRADSIAVVFEMGRHRVPAPSLIARFTRHYLTDYDVGNAIVNHAAGRKMTLQEYLAYVRDMQKMLRGLPDMNPGDRVVWYMSSGVCAVQHTPWSPGDDTRTKTDYVTAAASCQAMRFVWRTYFEKN
jgi:hypothetical protein